MLFKELPDRESLHCLTALAVWMIPSSVESGRHYRKYLTNKNQVPVDFDFRDVVPTNHKKIYDIHDVIKNFTDENSFVEVSREYAPNIVIGFAESTVPKITIILRKAFGGAFIAPFWPRFYSIKAIYPVLTLYCSYTLSA